MPRGVKKIVGPVVQNLSVKKEYQYMVEITRVKDGDTFVGNIDLGFGVWLRNRDFRVYGIDAYEHNLEKGKLGIEYGKINLEGKTLLVTTIKTGNEGDKYGRYLVKVLLPDGSDYGTKIIEAGLAVSYDGGTKILPKKDTP